MNDGECVRVPVVRHHDQLKLDATVISADVQGLITDLGNQLGVGQCRQDVRVPDAVPPR